MADSGDRNQPFRERDEVRLRDGMFAGSVGVVQKVLPKAERVVVRISVFGQSVPVEASLAQVERV
jgi:transcription antitermination factor NusG